MAIFTALLPLLLSIIGRILKSSDASQALLEKYDELVSASKDEGLISQDTRLVFVSQKAEVERQLAEDAAAKAKIAAELKG